MRYFVDQDGRYLGAWDENSTPPPGATQVSSAPSDARQIWDGQAWGVVPPLVPERVTMRQARLALLGAGLLGDVESAINSVPGEINLGGLLVPQSQVARIEWECSSEVWRNKPFVVQIGTALGLSSAQLDQLFITAAGIP